LRKRVQFQIGRHRVHVPFASRCRSAVRPQVKIYRLSRVFSGAAQDTCGATAEDR
jgi:hypothetical protein